MSPLQRSLARVLDWLYLMVILHMLWIAGLVVGLGLLGLGPATGALYSSLRDQRARDEVSARRLAVSFAGYYRQLFWRGNAYAWVCVLVGVGIALGYASATQVPGVPGVVSRAAGLCAAIAWVLAVLQLPVIATGRSARGVVTDLRAALLYALVGLPVSIAVLAVAVGSGVVVAVIPGMMLVLGLNVVADIGLRGEALMLRRQRSA